MNSRMDKDTENRVRLDQYLVNEGYVTSRDKAKVEIKTGNVEINGEVSLKPSYKVIPGDTVVFQGTVFPYVSRGALKLLKAISGFNIDISGKSCLDIGASTGGFTEVLLEKGASDVTAVDVGHDQLANKIKNDPRVRSIEGFNFRDSSLVKMSFKDKIFDLVVCDVSFISIKLLTDSFKAVFNTETQGVILIKPQFEAGRQGLNKKGVVTEITLHKTILASIVEHFTASGFGILNIIPSPIRGGDGNIEYLMYINSKTDNNISEEEIYTTVNAAFEES